MADRHTRNLICRVFPCQLHAHFGLSTDVFYFLCETTKNDYAIPPSIKSNRPLRFLNPTLISNLMHQFKTYTRQQKRKMPYPKHLKHP